MITPKLIIGFVVGVLLLAGLAWLLWSVPDASAPGTQTQGTGFPEDTNYIGYPSGSGEDTDENSPAKRKAAAAVNIDKAYQEAFVALSANFIEFASVASATGDATALYSLYAADVAEAKKLYPNVAKYAIEVSLVDLDGDGANEALVLESLPGFCGRGSCPLDVYKNKSGQWVKVSSFTANGSVGIELDKTEGYRNLLVSIQDKQTGVSQIWRCIWDGTQYKIVTSVAVWTGDKFVAP
ncbi:MAG TPA: hypothetical protein VJJ20_02080 [Candidatus Paceibacterota bacterium]